MRAALFVVGGAAFLVGYLSAVAGAVLAGKFWRPPNVRADMPVWLDGATGLPLDVAAVNALCVEPWAAPWEVA